MSHQLMVHGWLRKLVLAAALAAMPAHGIAAALSVLLCHGDTAAHTSHAAAAHEHADHAGGHAQGAGETHDHGAPQSDDSATSPIVHLCCNLSASMPVSVTFSAALPEFIARTFVPDTLLDLYDPEQLQRPPLA